MIATFESFNSILKRTFKSCFALELESQSFWNFLKRPFLPSDDHFSILPTQPVRLEPLIMSQVAEK